MNDNIKDANLDLLIGLKQHLDQAAKLRALLERLLSLAQSAATQPKPTKEQRHECAK